MYVVSRETIDYHNDPSGGLHDTEIIGTFSSRHEANKVARTNLLNEWDEDFFETYDIEEENGLVTVTATCPEGEEMTVTVEKVRTKMSRGPPPKSSEPDAQKVYIVKRETIDYHNDPDGGVHYTKIVGTFSSRKEANQAARKDLLNSWDKSVFESYDVEEENGLVTVTATFPEGEEMTVTVEESQLSEGFNGESNKDLDEDSDEETDEYSNEECLLDEQC